MCPTPVQPLVHPITKVLSNPLSNPLSNVCLYISPYPYALRTPLEGSARNRLQGRMTLAGSYIRPA
ncbi:hypothetical protein LY39_00275 [Roseinatronobacter bogoriensis subsp. barguzinensis]|nr:hypothetical protein [Rhodobaca bogoriensis DSM 18756]TDW41174.1 hypothetical protein LY39_00275 [Rhodobaca barguzinensis]TDY74648.1 hypothetical protein EV660_101689 [Rhodobaca bogoriensis DSM 18756]